MSVQASRAQSTMTTKEMIKMFLPIVFFSIVLPFIDIVTDLRLIVRLYSGVYRCIPFEDLGKFNISYSVWGQCRDSIGTLNTLYSDNRTNYCTKNPMPKVCTVEEHNKFATILLGEYTNIQTRLVRKK